MKKLNLKDLRKQSKSDLLKKTREISKDLIKKKFLKAEGNIENKNHVFSAMRKNISRILTILREKND